MPLTRYQIPHEYGLGHTELYGAVDRNDPEALLEGVAMAGLVGLLRQLGDLAEFAAEVFCCLHEELMTTAGRGHGLMIRLQQLEAEFPSVEKALLSQTDHLLFFSDPHPGLDWHPCVRAEDNLIACGHLPRCILDSYEECRGPPSLFLLDKFDVAGAGSCLKRYSDPSLFRTRTVSESATSHIQIIKESRKLKKKRSKGIDEEIPEVAPTSHAKLLQLFLMDHVETSHREPRFHVKPKRRQLNGSPIDSSSGRSYMEKFVKIPLLDHETSPWSHSKLGSHTLRNENASESGTSDKLHRAIGTEVKVCNLQEVLLTPSTVYSNSGNTGKGFEMELQSVSDDGIEIPCTQNSVSEEKPLTNPEAGQESNLEVSHFLDLTNIVNNYTDVHASGEPEIGSGLKPNDLGHLRSGEHHTCLDAPETQMEVPACFFCVLHHSLEEEESKFLHNDFSRPPPESEPRNTEGSAETSDLSLLQPRVIKDDVRTGTPELEETLFNLSSCVNPQNQHQNTRSNLQLYSENIKADDIETTLSKISAFPEVKRGTMLSIPSEVHQEYLSEPPQAPSEAEESRVAVLLTNHDDNCDAEDVSNVETESVISFSVLMDDQFSSLTNQEVEVLKPESVSSEVDASLSGAESNSKAMPVTLESDKILPTKDAGAANGFEELFLVAIAHDDPEAEAVETNSENRSFVNTESGILISSVGISSKDSSMMSDADPETGSEHVSASSSHGDPLVNPYLAAGPSYSDHEDMQTVSMVVDDSDRKETISKGHVDTLICEASLSNDVDHDQTGLSIVALETMLETDMRTSILPVLICNQQENLLVTQECYSSENCSLSWDQRQDIQSRHVLVDPIAKSAEALPSDVTTHDVSIDPHGLSSVVSAIGGSKCCLQSDTKSPWQTSHLQNSEKALSSGLTELEALHDANKENSTSLVDHCSEPMLSMDQAYEENCLAPEAAPPCSVSLYEETQAGPDCTPPLPPLPPTQWWIGKLIESIKTSAAPFPSEESLAAGGNSRACEHMEEYTAQVGSTAVDSMLNETTKATETLLPSFTVGGNNNISVQRGESTPNGSAKTTEAPFSSVSSCATGEIALLAASATDRGAETSEVQHFQQSLGERSDPQPAIPMAQTANVEEISDLGQHEKEGETKTPDAFKPSQTLRDENSYKKPLREKLSGHKASLGNAVVAIDRSVLRKASERAGAPVEREQDSLLEIIRSKSFNLRPAAAAAGASRPSVQAVPITNLRIAAILEKALSLRQAMAGSDDDDNDSDSWSDT